MSNLGYIYIIESPYGKNYIGQTIDIKRRIKEYNRNNKNFKKQVLLYNHFNKYNIDVKDYIRVIEVVDVSKLNDREIFWIEKYDTFKNGLNMTIGGNSFKGGVALNEEHRLKISIANKGKKRTKKQIENISRGCLGRIISKDTRDKISKANSNENHWLYNKKHSIETKNKISNSLKNRININNKNQYSVIAFKNGVIIDIFNSLSECSHNLFGDNKRNLDRVVNGLRKSYKGYIIKKLSDFIPKKVIIKQ